MSAGGGLRGVLPVVSRNWWALALRGALAIIFGIVAFLSPGITLLALVLLFGAYMLVDGILAIVAGVWQAGRSERWWLLLIEGVVGVLAGIIAFASPQVTALALLYLVAAWAIVTGVLEIIAAVRLRQEIEGEWALIVGGVVSVAFGVLLAVLPGVGILSLVWLIGAYAVMFGVLLIALALRVRETPRVHRLQRSRRGE
jgi:uncharacterized membrane protein HdeD (DUF308 family)